MSVLYIQFPDDFENRYTKFKEKILGSSTAIETQTKPAPLPTEKSKVLNVQLRQGNLTLNESAGSVQLNEVKASINPQSQEFAFLRTLMSSDGYLATYIDLLGEKPSKIAKRKLVFIIRNTKEILGILPKGQAQNQDCIENIKGHGYKLIT
jgi:DNA-binding response OmpR family regulator